MNLNVDPLPVSIRNIIDESDFSEFVSEVYGRPYRLQQQDGCMSRRLINVEYKYPGDYMRDDIPYEINGDVMGVSFDAWKARPVGVEADIWWQRNFYPELYTVFADLVKHGLIAPGEYDINVDW